VIGEEALDCTVGALPDGNGLSEELSSLWGKCYQAGAAVGGVGCDFDQSAALEGFESCCQGGAIHCE